MKENPGASVSEIARILGEEWKTLSTYEKERYIDAYTEEMERFGYVSEDEEVPLVLEEHTSTRQTRSSSAGMTPLQWADVVCTLPTATQNTFFDALVTRCSRAQLSYLFGACERILNPSSTATGSVRRKAEVRIIPAVLPATTEVHHQTGDTTDVVLERTNEQDVVDVDGDAAEIPLQHSDDMSQQRPEQQAQPEKSGLKLRLSRKAMNAAQNSDEAESEASEYENTADDDPEEDDEVSSSTSEHDDTAEEMDHDSDD